MREFKVNGAEIVLITRKFRLDDGVCFVIKLRNAYGYSLQIRKAKSLKSYGSKLVINQFHGDDLLGVNFNFTDFTEGLRILEEIHQGVYKDEEV